MIIIISVCIIAICAIIAILRAEKPVSQIIIEAKLEIQYNIIGMNGLIDDFLGKKYNKIGKYYSSIIV